MDDPDATILILMTNMIQRNQFENLMVSHDLPRSKVTNQITFDKRSLHQTPEFERTMDRPYQVLAYKLET